MAQQYFFVNSKLGNVRGTLVHNFVRSSFKSSIKLLKSKSTNNRFQTKRSKSVKCLFDERSKQAKTEQIGLSDDQKPSWFSELINKELLMFMMQQWYDIQLNRALNKEQYELAQSVRDERAALDQYLEKYLIKKGPGGGTRSTDEVSQDFDVATRVLTLTAEMQKAVSEERYKDAARLRDEIQLLNQQRNSESNQSALNAEWGCVASPPKFRLGQLVEIRKDPEDSINGVVAGWDTQCCESEEWCDRNGVNQLKAGSCQPFYHLLIHARDWGIKDPAIPPVIYVPEELLLDVEECEEKQNEQNFEHPYLYNLFYGRDHNGDMIPIFPLKSKFGERIED
eukprot:TRINITY_DN2861_c0_g1_i4.p1 TRINITY_DN2861_c0_g1~~TRINITY_DN2861_c0_g1_i4.p1  ORF type:complete len:346 (-),score=25.06 TRINITY_DN2861_c0_g1_i4:250-1263(-)